MSSLLWQDQSFDPDRVPHLIELYEIASLRVIVQYSPLRTVAEALLLRARSFWNGWPPSANPYRANRLHQKRRDRMHENIHANRRWIPRDPRKNLRQALMHKYLCEESKRWLAMPRLDSLGVMPRGDTLYYEGHCKPSCKLTQAERAKRRGYREVEDRLQRFHDLAFYDPEKRPR